MSVAEIVSRLGTLTQQERADLASAVLLSLEADEGEGVEEAWSAELARRGARIRSGEATAVPAEQVFAERRWKR